MSNIEIQRDHNGALHMLVGGQHALGAQVLKIDALNGGLAAVIVVPLEHVTVSEATNIVPFVRVERK
jgi:hypothetical protein